MIEYPYSLVCKTQARIVQINYQQQLPRYQEDEENYQSDEDIIQAEEEEEDDVDKLYTNIDDYD